MISHLGDGTHNDLCELLFALPGIPPKHRKARGYQSMSAMWVTWLHHSPTIFVESVRESRKWLDNRGKNIEHDLKHGETEGKIKGHVLVVIWGAK